MKCDTIPDLESFLAIQEKAMGVNSPEVASTIGKLVDLYIRDQQLDKAEHALRRIVQIRSSLSGFHRMGLEEAELRLQEVLRQKKGPLVSSTNFSKVSTPVSSSDALPAATTAPNPQSQPAPLQAEAQAAAPAGASIKDPLTTRHASFEPAETPHATPQKTTRSARAINDAIHDTELEIELLKQMVGPEDPAVADLLTRLADLYCRVRMYSKMEPVLVDALKIREAACGTDHASVSTELKNLASLYCVQERYALAEPLFKRAISIREKTFGRLHPRVADVEEQYAQLLRRTNRVHQAEAIEKHINEIRTQHDSPSHPRNGTFFGVS